MLSPGAELNETNYFFYFWPILRDFLNGIKLKRRRAPNSNDGVSHLRIVLAKG